MKDKLIWFMYGLIITGGVLAILIMLVVFFGWAALLIVPGIIVFLVIAGLWYVGHNITEFTDEMDGNEQVRKGRF